MARVKNSVQTRKRRKKILKQAKGYFGSKHRLFRTAQEQVMKSGNYAFRDRKQKKRDFRKLWITRINAAVREYGMSYSKFMNGLNKAGIELNRKILSEIAINDEKAFKELVEASQKALDGKVIVKKEVVEKKEAKKAEDKPVKEETKKSVKQDFSKLTVAELRDLAKEKKLAGYSTLKKQELIDLLESNL